jgi:hypothetical protein
MPAVISTLLAVAGGACLAFWVTIAMALPLVDLISRVVG